MPSNRSGIGPVNTHPCTMRSAIRAGAFFSLFALVGPASAAGPVPASNVGPVETNVMVDDQIAFGVYDPHSTFAAADDVAIEHVFIYWQALDGQNFRKNLQYAMVRHRRMMVTIEPYTRASDWRSQGERLFSDILAGDFDQEIQVVCSEVGNFQDQVLVRWGHEMEDPTGRYPWARTDSEGFKSAFRYFVQHCRQHAPNAIFVWSPKGEKNLAAYYPGDDIVDVVGLSVYGLQKMDLAFYGRIREFSDNFEEKYQRVAGFNKPVVIAELGVSGDQSYRRRWFASLFEALKRSVFQKLRAVVYFNDKEPDRWPMGFGSPDWRITPDWLSEMKQARQASR